MSNIELSMNDYIINYDYEKIIIKLQKENDDLKAEINILKDIIKDKFIDCAKEKKILRDEIEFLKNKIKNQ